MKTSISRSIRIISLSGVAVAAIWFVYFRLVSAESVRSQPPVRVLDLRTLLGVSAETGPHQFLSVRASDLGLFVWMESGGSPRSGSRTVTVFQITETGGLLQSTPLPPGAGLTVTQDFGLDDAGNLYFLQIRPAHSGGSDSIFLLKVDPRGETVEEHVLPGRPSTFAVGRQGRVFLLTDDAEVSSPEAPAMAITRGNAPQRVVPGGPPGWLPLLELASGGKLALIDGVSGTIETLEGSVPAERRQIASPDLQAAVHHIAKVHQKPAGIRSIQPALRSSSVDETGRLSFTLMGTRPSHGVVVVRTDAEGNSLPSLRFEAPLDTNRPQNGRPPVDGEAALMFPHDLALWRGKAFILGVHGLLAVYEVRQP